MPTGPDQATLELPMDAVASCEPLTTSRMTPAKETRREYLATATSGAVLTPHAAAPTCASHA